LWRKALGGAETLAASCFPTSCPLSRQANELNEINDLRAQHNFEMMRRNTRSVIYDGSKSWG
jgi:hypothetical protein